ncbi:hypothetical protein JXA32_07085 [Candidatus Sumerlaeota bacterium]|nr:hypothetical protein [Candidatus Sumerlaeota bacterium]
MAATPSRASAAQAQSKTPIMRDANYSCSLHAKIDSAPDALFVFIYDVSFIGVKPIQFG